MSKRHPPGVSKPYPPWMTDKHKFVTILRCGHTAGGVLRSNPELDPKPGEYLVCPSCSNGNEPLAREIIDLVTTRPMRDSQGKS